MGPSCTSSQQAPFAYQQSRQSPYFSPVPCTFGCNLPRSISVWDGCWSMYCYHLVTLSRIHPAFEDTPREVSLSASWSVLWSMSWSVCWSSSAAEEVVLPEHTWLDSSPLYSRCHMLHFHRHE